MTLYCTPNVVLLTHVVFENNHIIWCDSLQRLKFYERVVILLQFNLKMNKNIKLAIKRITKTKNQCLITSYCAIYSLQIWKLFGLNISLQHCYKTIWKCLLHTLIYMHSKHIWPFKLKSWLQVIIFAINYLISIKKSKQWQWNGEPEETLCHDKNGKK